MRNCELCGAAGAETLHRQEFLAAGERCVVHDVVACGRCGFGYVRRSGEAPDLAEHYERTRKYVHEGSGGRATGLLEAHRGFALFVEEALAPHAGKRAAILDVGCAAGHLLARLRELGFLDLSGLEPSAGAREAARRLHGLEVSGERLEDFRPGRLYDAVLLANVLEHVEGLVPFARAAARLLAPGGTLVVQVPDASRFGVELEEPFQEFSLEHVNFFTAESLSRLLAAAGLAPALVRHEVVRSGASRGPALTAAYRSGASGEIPPADPRPLLDYVRRSRESAERIERAVSALVASGEEFFVWGAGALAARLLATTPLGRGRIAAFVDSDTSLAGLRLAGREIAPPERLRGSSATVLVASVRWGPEIRATLAGPLGHRGRVVSLDAAGG